jgi:hypothetical protein
MMEEIEKECPMYNRTHSIPDVLSIIWPPKRGLDDDN